LEAASIIITIIVGTITIKWEELAAIIIVNHHCHPIGNRPIFVVLLVGN